MSKYQCLHGKIKYNCVDCNPCPHRRNKYKCEDCNQCPHGINKYKCKECISLSCPHGRRKKPIVQSVISVHIEETNIHV
jgi:hypothetical protein